MYGNIEEITKKILESTDLDEDKIQNMIKEKENEFSGLISPEGAAHIVAKELGLDLLKSGGKKDIRIENLMSGMNTVHITGKITKIFEPREFKKDGKTGKVVNIIIGDETGKIRMSLWNDQVKAVEDGDLAEGKVIEIRNGYTKPDNKGSCELRLGKSGKVEISEKKIDVKTESSQSMRISDMEPGSFPSIRGAMLQFFDSRNFYMSCPECNSKVTDGKCDEHGEVKPKPVMIISGILDDGYGNVRVVFFREQAEKVLGMETKKAFKLSDKGRENSALREILDKRLGTEFKIKGRAKINKFFERIELVASEVEEVNPEAEAKAILNNLESKN